MLNIFEAIDQNKPQLVQEAINAGADLNTPHPNLGHTPAGWTAAKGYNVILQMLIDAGASLERDDFGYTPVFLAVEKGHESTLQQLIDAGANVNTYDMNYRSPIYMATAARSQSMVRRLIAAGADVNPPERPLAVANSYSDADMVRLLTNAGAVVEARPSIHQENVLIVEPLGALPRSPRPTK